MWAQRWIEQVGQDLRFALRMLRSSPGFSAVAVLSIALGVGANTAIFSAIDSLMFRTLPVRSPEQLVVFVGKYVNTVGASSSQRTSYDFPHPTLERFRELEDVFSDVSGIWEVDRSNVAADGPADVQDAGQTSVGLTSGNYFSTLGANALIGRTFTMDDDRIPGGHPLAVISSNYWERRFSRDPNVLGRTLTLNGTTYSIIGVAQRGFTGDWVGRRTDLWIPFMMASQVMPEVPGGPSKFPARVIGRLKPNVKIEQAQAGAQVVLHQNLMERAGPNPTPQRMQWIALQRLELEPAARGYSPQRNTFGQPLAILMIVVALVLLIACANVANLLLVRSAARQREMAVRRALGAGRLRIVRQTLTESVLLAILGGAVGLAISAWGTNALAAFVRSGPVGGAAPLSIDLDLTSDARVLVFATALCLFTGVLFGLVPSLRSSNVSLTPLLTGRGATATGSPGRFGFGKALVISQVALSLILLIGAGLFIRSLRNLRTQDLGFDREHVLLVWTAPVQTGRVGPALPDLYQRMQERLSNLPGVLSAMVSTGGMLQGGDEGGLSETLKVEGQEPKPGLVIREVTVTPGFFETLGMPLLAGRDFTDQDTDKSPSVAIISETMARFYFGDENPVGRRFAGSGEAGSGTEIIGVVKDAKHGTPRDKRGIEYVPYRQNTRVLRLPWCAAVRTAGSPTAIASSVRQGLKELDPNLPVLKIATIDEQLDGVLLKERLIAALSGFFGVLSVLLACLGLYGVISYSVVRRTNEIGIRLAMGGTPAGVLRMMLKESLTLVLVGIVIGVPATLATSRLISSLLFGIGAADPLTLVAATLMIVTVAGLAALLPALRASRVQPMIALRYE